MNTLDLIESDFKTLQGEMKKKYAHIKDVIPYILTSFKSVDRALKTIQNSKG